MKKCLLFCLIGALCISLSCSGCVETSNSEDSLTESIVSSESKKPVTETEAEPDISSGKTDEGSKNESDSGNDSSKAESKTESKAESQTITADKTSVHMTEGETITIAVTTSPNTNDKLTWESSDDQIAAVDALGNITALGEGKCVVTVRSESDKNAVQSIRVTVSPKSEDDQSDDNENNEDTITYLESDEGQNMLPQEDAPKSKVESVTPSADKITIALGQKAQLTATVYPLNVDTFDLTWATSNDFIATVDESGMVTANEEGTCIITVTSLSNKDAKADIEIEVTKPVVTANENEEELPRQELYIDGILIVNKSYSLPRDYNPGGLTAECSSAFEELRQGAAEDGITIYLSSGFRSYDTQNYLYNGYVYYYGQATADTFSARPGHSEHQTGLAIDCNIISDAFIGTPEAIWLEEHCHEYGFIIRYPKGKESITGYKYEPWHIRYVGVENAEKIHDSGLTLEEYFGISSVYDY